MMRVLALFALTATKINHTVPTQYAPCSLFDDWEMATCTFEHTKPIEWYPERCLHVPNSRLTSVQRFQTVRTFQTNRWATIFHSHGKFTRFSVRLVHHLSCPYLFHRDFRRRHELISTFVLCLNSIFIVRFQNFRIVTSQCSSVLCLCREICKRITAKTIQTHYTQRRISKFGIFLV